MDGLEYAILELFDKPTQLLSLGVCFTLASPLSPLAPMSCPCTFVHCWICIHWGPQGCTIPISETHLRPPDSIHGALGAAPRAHWFQDPWSFLAWHGHHGYFFTRILMVRKWPLIPWSVPLLEHSRSLESSLLAPRFLNPRLSRFD